MQTQALSIKHTVNGCLEGVFAFSPPPALKMILCTAAFREDEYDGLAPYSGLAKSTCW